MLEAFWGSPPHRARGGLAVGGRMGVLQAVKAAACAGGSLCSPGPPGIVAVAPCLARHRTNPGTGTRPAMAMACRTAGRTGAARLLKMTVPSLQIRTCTPPGRDTHGCGDAG